jgi:glyoxylate carboligase
MSCLSLAACSVYNSMASAASRACSPHELAAAMHQARAVQARHSVFYVESIPEFEYKLSHRPGPLIAGTDQQAEYR